MSEWGPLQALIGDWEGEGGLDTAYSHAQQKVIETPYLEKLSMKPFGPVGNGKQELYGLDYKTAMWRDNEDEPFHTEVGYWLWDAASGEIAAHLWCRVVSPFLRVVRPRPTRSRSRCQPKREVPDMQSVKTHTSKVLRVRRTTT